MSLSKPVLISGVYYQRKTDKMDWNQNGDIRDNKFNDQYHFEL